jgi:hypothetical protein
MKIYRELWYCCQFNEYEKVIHILKCYKKLDLTYDEGQLFRFSIMNNNVEMLRALLKYYRKQKLQGDDNSGEYKLAKYKLLEILRVAADRFKISEETQEVLSPYMPYEEDNSSEQDLEGLDELIRLTSSDIHDQAEKVEISHDYLIT